MAAILNTNAGTIFDRQYCGGSLLASKYVLTSASCVITDTANIIPLEAAQLQVTNIIH